MQARHTMEGLVNEERDVSLHAFGVGRGVDKVRLSVLSYVQPRKPGSATHSSQAAWPTWPQLQAAVGWVCAMRAPSLRRWSCCTSLLPAAPATLSNGTWAFVFSTSTPGNAEAPHGAVAVTGVRSKH